METSAEDAAALLESTVTAEPDDETPCLEEEDVEEKDIVEEDEWSAGEEEDVQHDTQIMDNHMTEGDEECMVQHTCMDCQKDVSNEVSSCHVVKNHAFGGQSHHYVCVQCYDKLQTDLIMEGVLDFDDAYCGESNGETNGEANGESISAESAAIVDTELEVNV